MEYNNQPKYLGKLLAGILFVVFLVLIGMISLTFLAPKNTTFELKKTLPYPIDSVWNTSNDLETYKNSRENITNFIIKDTFKPRWVEYYGSSDSMEVKTTHFKPNSYKYYIVLSQKYEQAIGVGMYLSPKNDSTVVTMKGKTVYQNVWARVYYTILSPNTAAEFEFYKLESVLKKKYNR
jgi:hypothetical protein